MKWFSGSTARHLPGVNCSAAWKTVNKWELEHPGGEESLSMPWEINNKGEVFPLASTTSLPRAPRSCRECPGLVLSQLPETLVFITTLFNQGSSLSVSAQPLRGQIWSAINQNPHRKVASQRSEGKKTDKRPPLPPGWKRPQGPQASRKKGLCAERSQCGPNGMPRQKTYSEMVKTNWSDLITKVWNIISFNYKTTTNLFNEL